MGRLTNAEKERRQKEKEKETKLKEVSNNGLQGKEEKETNDKGKIIREYVSNTLKIFNTKKEIKRNESFRYVNEVSNINVEKCVLFKRMVNINTIQSIKEDVTNNGRNIAEITFTGGAFMYIDEASLINIIMEK